MLFLNIARERGHTLGHTRATPPPKKNCGATTLAVYEREVVWLWRIEGGRKLLLFDAPAPSP